MIWLQIPFSEFLHASKYSFRIPDFIEKDRLSTEVGQDFFLTFQLILIFNSALYTDFDTNTTYPLKQTFNKICDLFIYLLFR